MNYRHVCVGTANLNAALALWRGFFGMAIAADDLPDSQDLERLWRLPVGSISRCCRLETPGAQGGALLLVEFSESAPVIRANAGVTDLCPKNLDVNCIDLPARVRELEAAGLHPRSAPVEYRIGDLEVREVQMPLEEGVNLVLAEILGEALVTTPTHYGALTSIVTTTADIGAETQFFQALGFARLDAHRLTGPEVERMVGLPNGGVLDMQLLGEASHRFGRAELVSYGAASGADRYPLARPPARGLFRGAVTVGDPAATRLQCEAAGYAVTDLVELTGSRTSARACSVRSPSGWWIDLLPA